MHSGSFSASGCPFYCVVLSSHGLLCNAVGFSFCTTWSFPSVFFKYISPPGHLVFLFSAYSSILVLTLFVCLSRYLKRGVNEKGRVANDVETEQILFEDVPEDFPVQISSVVQNRGSIPLFWFQETSRLNLKPDIICFFYCQVTPPLRSEGCLKWPTCRYAAASNVDPLYFDPDVEKQYNNDNDESDNSEGKTNGCNYVMWLSETSNVPEGVLRTNCIDCFGSIMWHTHNKIFSERRGQWKAAIQSQEFFRTLQRYYSNAYMDAEKQNAINVRRRVDLIYRVDSYQHYYVGRNGESYVSDNGRSLFQRSFSDGNILHESQFPLSTRSIGKRLSKSNLSNQSKEGSKVLSESTPEMSTCESDLTYSRCHGRGQQSTT
ncbi:hypothetical protein HAX54_047572 [Datura stramonium]|uniref:SAC domain-containing protein n=1 Tax=Datura stramonium TaxID=4076 RepID=A0ABS8SSK6_DATST|nr:hypothetical protein [Datura stramonium]